LLGGARNEASPYGFRLTNFVNFGASPRQGVVNLEIRYYI